MELSLSTFKPTFSRLNWKKVILGKVDLVRITKMPTKVQIEVEDIDHLGIIAGIIDEIGIVEIMIKS